MHIIPSYVLSLLYQLFALTASGVFVIGQEQDRQGGKYSPQEAFAGEITLLNVWSEVLPESKVLTLHSECQRYVGDVKGWPDFMAGLKGNIKVNIEISS